MAHKTFSIASKVDKGKSEPKPEKYIAESILKESKQKSDQSFPKWVRVPEVRFNFIKLEINKNKDLCIIIDNKRYELNDVNELVNKIANGKIGKNKVTKTYNNLVNKAKEITKLRSTPSRKNMLEIFNYLGLYV